MSILAWIVLFVGIGLFTRGGTALGHVGAGFYIIIGIVLLIAGAGLLLAPLVTSAIAGLS